MQPESALKYAKSTAEFIVGLVMLLATLSKVKPIEMWLEAKTKKWLTKQPERQIVRRFDQAELDRIQLSANEELDMICIMLKEDYAADRVSVIQYEKQPDGTYHSHWLAEDRAAGVFSIKSLHQNTPVPAQMWLEVQRVHELEGRFLYVFNAKTLDRKVLRAAMLRTGITSAYYQTLPDAATDCAALLSLSWKEPIVLDAAQLAHLQLSARLLAAMLREHWHLRPDASS